MLSNNIINYIISYTRPTYPYINHLKSYLLYKQEFIPIDLYEIKLCIIDFQENYIPLGGNYIFCYKDLVDDIVSVKDKLYVINSFNNKEYEVLAKNRYITWRTILYFLNLEDKYPLIKPYIIGWKKKYEILYLYTC